MIKKDKKLNYNIIGGLLFFLVIFIIGYLIGWFEYENANPYYSNICGSFSTDLINECDSMRSNYPCWEYDLKCSYVIRNETTGQESCPGYKIIKIIRLDINK